MHDRDRVLAGCLTASPDSGPDAGPPRCGDGNVDPGEACDDGNAIDLDFCTSACEIASCGDGIQQAITGEQCDDGNAVDTDACADCRSARCGDGTVEAGVEQCDDGNTDDTDGCTRACTDARCGDGVVEVGEECDDGNGVDVDLCTDTCTQARCGDGIVSVIAGEQCDDADADATDGCTTACTLATCGDGFVHAGVEACDDGDATADDGCDPGCVPTIVQVAAGEEFTCILTRSGRVKCWGINSIGQLGLGWSGNIGDDELPSSIGFVDVGGTVAQIAAADAHVCALLSSGAVRCWGLGSDGRLGYGNTNSIGDNEVPAAAGNVPFGATAASISASGRGTCVVTTSGAVRCWGDGQFGQLGYANTNDIGDNETPAIAGDVVIGGTATAVATSQTHTCAALTSGEIRCWGSSSYGQLGYGNTLRIGDNETPASVGPVNVGGVVAAVATGDDNSCVISNSFGIVRCWGLGSVGTNGNGLTYNTGDTFTPGTSNFTMVGASATQISVGRFRACALLTTGAVRCWGAGFSGGLGYGNVNNIGDDETPASVGDVPVGGTVVQIAVGTTHVCALLSTGGVRCWGNAFRGALGHGNQVDIGDDETPASVGDVPIF